MTHHLKAALPDELIRFTQLPNDKGHNAVWDFVRSPDGRFYVSVCGENEKPLTALLYEYDPETGALRLLFDVADVWIVDPEQMPPSKIHTSIDFLPDGRMIMATHNTAPAPGHRQWMYEQHYEHPWEGYPGSILMIVDPDTGKAQVRGIPVPRESIYGGMLGEDPRYYYFLGYMRGHFYRLDLATNEVKDYGKVSEFSSCRLVKDRRGRLYGSSYTGAFWRYDPGMDEIEDLKVSFRSPNGTRFRRQFIFALHSPEGTLFLVDNMDGELIELDPETLEVTRHGPLSLRGDPLVNPYGIGGLAADENFVLYYGLKTYDAYYPIRLVRWNVRNGSEPENLGLIAPGGKDSQYMCEMIFDERGILHMVDVCGEFSPYVLAVDVKRLRPAGPDSPVTVLTPYAEPDWNRVGEAAYMHIVAEETRVLPLHQYMNWQDTAVRHVSAFDRKLYAVSGRGRILLTEAAALGGVPLRIVEVYPGGTAVNCLDLEDGKVAALTEDGFLVVIDLPSLAITSRIALLSEKGLIKLHARILPMGNSPADLLASDVTGALYRCEMATGHLRQLRNICLAHADAHPILLDANRLLVSGLNDQLLLYHLTADRTEALTPKASSIRGRAFRAAITGGVQLEDGTVVCGTEDGLLFTLSSDLRSTTTFGRLYSSGALRNFLRTGEGDVMGIYGGARDAGHVFSFSHSRGLVDLGRPRVIKDVDPLREIDSEWASIHFISCLAYDSEANGLYVASGELYGCIVGFREVAIP